MKGRGLQIDVLGEVEQDKNIIICRLTIDGRDCRCLISRRDYEALGLALKIVALKIQNILKFRNGFRKQGLLK